MLALFLSNNSRPGIVCGSCFFRSVLCEYRSSLKAGEISLFWPQDWSDYMVSRGVSEEDQQEAARLTLDAVRFSPDDVDHSLQQFDTDHLGALAVSAEEAG